MKKVLALLGVLAMVTTANAALTQTTLESVDNTGFDAVIAQDDCIAGQMGVELDSHGWHPANPASGDPNHPYGLATFTDGLGFNASFAGLLNDFPPVGMPAKSVQYDLTGTACNANGIAQIDILAANQEDGRVFSTSVIKYSMDGGTTFQELGYFQSHPSGTVNSAGHPESIGIKASMVQLTDDLGGAIIPAGVTDVIVDLYGVDNTGGQMRDPFDGTNPFTDMDDGLSAPNTSPIIKEIDIIAVPEPASLALLTLGGLALVRRRR